MRNSIKVIRRLEGRPVHSGGAIPLRVKDDPLTLRDRVLAKCRLLWEGAVFHPDQHNPVRLPRMTGEEVVWSREHWEEIFSLYQFLLREKRGNRGRLQVKENEWDNFMVKHPACEWSHRGGAKPAWGSKVQHCFRDQQRAESESYIHPDQPNGAMVAANPFLNIRR